MLVLIFVNIRENFTRLILVMCAYSICWVNFTAIFGVRQLESLDCCLRGPMYSRFDIIRLVADGQTDGRKNTGSQHTALAQRRAVKTLPVLNSHAQHRITCLSTRYQATKRNFVVIISLEVRFECDCSGKRLRSDINNPE